MSAELITKYNLSMQMDKESLESSLKTLAVNAHRVANKYSTVADKVGKNNVDETKINKIRQATLAEMDEDVRNEHVEAVANFRNYVIEAVRQDRTAIFLIKDLMNEVSEFVTNVEDLVTKEVLPNKKSAERETHIKEAFGHYEEFTGLQAMLDNFTNMYSMQADLSDLDTSEWTEEDDDFEIKVKTLKDGSKKFSTPKLTNPTTRWNDAGKDTEVATLTPVITEIDGEETHITPTEFSVLYAQPLTGKYVSYKTVTGYMDFRQNEGEFKYPKDADDEQQTLTVKWAKSAI